MEQWKEEHQKWKEMFDEWKRNYACPWYWQCTEPGANINFSRLPLI